MLEVEKTSEDLLNQIKCHKGAGQYVCLGRVLLCFFRVPKEKGGDSRESLVLWRMPSEGVLPSFSALFPGGTLKLANSFKTN